MTQKRITITLNETQYNKIKERAEKESKEKNQKIFISRIVRRATLEYLSSKKACVVCCNDIPIAICKTEEIAREVVKENKKKHDSNNKWRIEECSYVGIADLNS